MTAPDLSLVGALVAAVLALVTFGGFVLRAIQKGDWAPAYVVDDLKKQRDDALTRCALAIDLGKTEQEHTRRAWAHINRLVALIPPSGREAAIRELRDAEGA